MIRNVKAIDLRSVFIIFIIIFIAMFLGKQIAYASSFRFLFLILGLVIAGITFINTEIGLLFIIFSMLLSPELTMGVIPGRNIALRSEDFLLLIVTFTWLVKTAINKELNLFRKSPLNVPIVIYIFICVLLTLRGVLIGHVNFLTGSFFTLKYIEYTILYFMVLNHVRTRSKIRVFMTAFLLTCAITCLYANLHIGVLERLSAPFEGEPGEPNTLGGYLVFMLAIVMGIILYTSSKKIKCWLGLLALFIFPALLFTLSRTSYIAVIPMWISLIVFSPKKSMLIMVLLWAIALSLIAMPQPVHKRITETFSGEVTQRSIENIMIGDVELDASASARILSWGAVLGLWKDRPFLGYGITGIGFVDGQYVRTIGEMGLVGIATFLFLLWSILKYAKQILLNVEDRFFKGLSLGFLTGFIGLLVFNGGANGFVLTRIMEPFWFMAAIVMVLPEIEYQEKTIELRQT